MNTKISAFLGCLIALGCRESSLSSLHTAPSLNVGEVVRVMPTSPRDEASVFPRPQHVLVQIRVDGQPLGLEGDCRISLFANDEARQPLLQTDCSAFAEAERATGCPANLASEFREEALPGSALWCFGSFPLHQVSYVEVLSSAGRVSKATSVDAGRVEGGMAYVTIDAH